MGLSTLFITYVYYVSCFNEIYALHLSPFGWGKVSGVLLVSGFQFIMLCCLNSGFVVAFHLLKA